jgi:glyoxylase-like metal-dependent hydrolase (beta-lactamase superfamily II)/Tfp pilus assembly protein PilF
MRGNYFLKANQAAVVVIMLLLLIGSALAESGDLQASSEAAIKKYKSSHIHFLKGEKQFRKGKYESSIKELAKCLDILSFHDRAHFYLAYIYYKQGELPKALIHIQKAKEGYEVLADLQFDEWLEVQQSVLDQIQRKQSLEGNLESVTDTCSYDEWAQMFNLSIDDAEQNIRNLEGEQRSAGISNSFPPADYFYLHGNILFKLKDFKQARENYTKAVEIDPKHTDAHNNLTAAFYSENMFREALDSIERAELRGIETNPDLKMAVMRSLDLPDAGIKEEEFPEGVKRFVVNVGDEKNIFQENTYIVFNVNSKDAVLIDPGIQDERIENYIKSKKLNVRMILNTHGHFDHVGANDFYSGLYGVDVLAHKADSALYEGTKNSPDHFFSKEGPLEVEGLKISVIHTPGHSAGSVCYLIDGIILTGDTLLKKSIGRTWGDTPLEEIENMNTEVENIKSKLFALPESTRIFPGHGSSSSISDEKKDNPFLDEDSAYEIFKRQFSSLPGIVKIERSKNDANDRDVIIRFRSSSDLDQFKNSYGEKFLGLKLRLISDPG